MPLAAGTRLGPYEVLSPIGKGGMGEVYRARDTKLDRDVAIKVLPEEFANDDERLARFEREAKLLASLNHPNIAGIYGVEDSDGVRALVLELVEGPTLAERLEGGRIAIDEALAIAKQIADALEAGHEAGIIHRDLKPANVKLKEDGTVKLLDYGLAKAFEGETASGSDSQLSQSPTRLRQPVRRSLDGGGGFGAASAPGQGQGTQVGLILGTAAYMSPEQAKGKRVDKRTDVWAFGAVLFEMLTGKRAFEGEEVSEILASVIKSDPDWSALPKALSPTLRTYLKQCLHKDPKARVRDIGDVRLAIGGAFDVDAAISTPVRPVERARWLGAIVLSAVLGGAAVSGLFLPAASPESVTRLGITFPEGRRLSGTGRHTFAVAPNGSYIVYTASEDLWIRRLDELEATPIVTGEGAREPFVSPDGQWIGFFSASQDQLMKVAVSGGVPVVLCAVDDLYGASWGESDVILFGQGPRGIWSVSAGGGTPDAVIDVDVGEMAHAPQLLPGGEWVLFTWRPSFVASWDDAHIVVQSLETGERELLVDGAREAHYLPTGHLTYVRQGILYGAPFDARRRELRGGPMPLLEGIASGGSSSGAAQLRLSSDGMLVYRPGPEGVNEERGLVRVDRDGNREPLSVAPGPYLSLRVSPDGNHVTLDVDAGANRDVWVAELERGARTRATTNKP